MKENARRYIYKYIRTFQGGFGARVHPPGSDTQPGGDAAHEDEGPGAAGAHVWEDGAGEVQGSEDVGGELAEGLFVAGKVGKQRYVSRRKTIMR